MPRKKDLFDKAIEIEKELDKDFEKGKKLLKKKVKFRKTKITVGTLLLMVICFLVGVYFFTGFLQLGDIDARDLEYWNYTSEGVIHGAGGFNLYGKNDTCWLLVHGYSSTPHDVRPLAEGIHEEFNETVFVPLLEGHATVPSEMRNLTFDDWYLQIEKEFLAINNSCEKVNVVGFSMGGALTLKLAEEYDLNNVYTLSPFLRLTYKWYRLFTLENYMKYTSDWTFYSKKSIIGQSNSAEGLKEHIAYWNMPFQPAKNSFESLRQVEENLYLIEEPILIQHPVNDETIDVKSSEIVNEKVSSEIKEFILFEKSNHVIFRDFESDEAISNILEFEKERRNQAQ